MQVKFSLYPGHYWKYLQKLLENSHGSHYGYLMEFGNTHEQSEL